MKEVMEKHPKILEISDLSNHYQGKPLLQNIFFSLATGEILSLLGPSGSGKTTLLRLIAGLEKIESGSIFFNGKNIAHVPPHNRNIGMMFQEYALFPHKNVKENIAFGLEMRKLSKIDKDERIASILKVVGLLGLEHRKIHELSGGERQRVALARSLAPQPRLLLLDEPLGSLDRSLRDRLAGEIREILKSLQVTAIFVTHDQEEAFTVADTIAVLTGGILQQVDSPENLYLSPKNTTVARFLGFTNFLSGILEEPDVVRTESGDFRLRVSLPPYRKEAVLLVRPEGARLIARDESKQSNVVSGTVLSRIFQGSRYRVSISSAKRVFTFDLPNFPVPPGKNEPIHLLLNPSSLVLLDENDRR